MSINPLSEFTKVRPQRSAGFPWYDSGWLDCFFRACELVRTHHPARLMEFQQALAVFETSEKFEVQKLTTVFDEETMSLVRSTVDSLRPDELELHEAKQFHRFVVHDHPFFTRLQNEIVPLVGDVVGEAVEISYNFLSMYSSMGVCPLHMDSPEAKWTLDLCINQTQPWPIHFSQTQPWASSLEPLMRDPSHLSDWSKTILDDPGSRFTSHVMKPGEAIVFSGSSQWHYRNALPARGVHDKCDLLFFHFIPKGTAELVKPNHWAHLFDMPELAQLGHDWLKGQ
jgi:hypothetical protein